MAKLQTTKKVNLKVNSTTSVNDTAFLDIERVVINLRGDDKHLSAIGTLYYNDGVKDIKVDTVNIDLQKADIDSVLGTQVNDLDAILQKIGIESLSKQLNLLPSEIEEKGSKKVKK